MFEKEIGIGADSYDSTLTYEDYYIERKLLTGEERCDTLNQSEISDLILDDIYNI